ncbi:MAG: amino acid ABC transporter permease [Rhabdochlamydiaceae bacterium]|nr:amino acid ABC transporter permease [Rhabdochlamydiaceae bacterium]
MEDRWIMNYDLFSRCWPLLWQGAQMSVLLLVFSAFLSFALGLVFGVFSCNRLRIPIVSEGIEAITFIYRAVPFYVQLLLLYFCLPDLLGWNLQPFQASVLSLGMCSSGYVAHIVRSGMNSIPAAQWEASFSLGYGRWKSLQAIIFPQMFRNALPAFTNELDSLLKSSAIVSSIGLLEITRAGMNLVSRELEPVPIYLLVALWYLCLSAIFNAFMRILERKMRLCYL